MVQKSKTEPHGFRINDYPLFRMAQIISATHELIVSRVSSYKLTPSSWRAIALLAEGQDWTVRSLAKCAAIERSALSRILDRLEHDDLIERTPNPQDGRSSYLTLTSKGRLLYAECEPIAVDAMNKAFGGISTQDKNYLTALLDQIGEHLNCTPAKITGGP